MKWINKKSKPNFKGLETVEIKHKGLTINIPKGYWFAVGQMGYANAYEEEPEWDITFGMVGYWNPLYGGIKLGKVDLEKLYFRETLIQG